MSRHGIAPMMKTYALALCVFCTVCSIGCQQQSIPVSDVSSGRKLLESTLKDWQAGVPWRELKERTPPIYVSEEMWTNGFRLEEFSIDNDGELYGTNVRLQVSLKGTDATGSKSERKVTYLVTTTPALTIAREER